MTPHKQAWQLIIILSSTTLYFPATVRLKCRDLVKKIAVYKNKLAVRNNICSSTLPAYFYLLFFNLFFLGSAFREDSGIWVDS